MNKKILIKKGLVFAVIVLFIGMSAVPSTSSLQLEKNNSINEGISSNPVYSLETTIYVDDNNTDGPWEGTIEYPYQYIQDGINAAEDDDTVYVFNGTYYEELRIIKRESIDLIGEDKNSTVIDGGMHINSSSGITLCGFTIQNELLWELVFLSFSSDCNIIGNTFRVMEKAGDGIFAVYSSKNTISKNTFILIKQNSNGMFLYFCFNNAITNNTFTTEPGTQFNGSGIYLGCSQKNLVSNNIITNLYNTIMLASAFPYPFPRSKNNIISNNTITNNYCGVDLLNNACHNIISQNNISGNGECGDGMLISLLCNNNIIYKNTISNNKDWGIWIDTSSNNKFIANTITDNGDYGVLSCGLMQPVSFNNQFYYNNFARNNKGNAVDFDINFWYKPESFLDGKGNYWDDYTGIDEDDDGIGDTPYNVPGRLYLNKDRFPLMELVDIENIEVEEVEESINEVIDEYNQDVSQGEIRRIYLTVKLLSPYINMHRYCRQSILSIKNNLLQTRNFED